MIDALAENGKFLAEYKQVYKQLILSKKELQELQLQKNSFQKELDYNQFLFDELKELQLKENELENLDIELKILSNSEGIKTSLTKVYFELKENELPIVQNLKQLINQLQTYSSYHSNIETIIERLHSANIELQDIAAEVEDLNNTINYDENRVAIINDKISLGYKLLKKHNVKTTNELLLIQQELEQKLQAVLNIDASIIKKDKEVNNLMNAANSVAASISTNRNKQVLPFAKNVNDLLHKVGMPNAILKVDIKEILDSEEGLQVLESGHSILFLNELNSYRLIFNNSSVKDGF